MEKIHATKVHALMDCIKDMSEDEGNFIVTADRQQMELSPNQEKLLDRLYLQFYD